MAKYPGATWRPLKENDTQPAIVPTQLIFHSAVSKADSLSGYFGRDDVKVESHLYVQDDGDTEQYIDSEVRADANYKASVRAISVETWDDGNPDVVPWTPKQLRRLADIAAWAHLEHDIPLTRAPGPNEPGMGGHTDYKSWSNVKGKTCPGIARRGQLDIIIKMAKAIVAGKLASQLIPKEGLVLDPATLGQFKKLLQAELRTVLGNANNQIDADKTHYSLADVERDMSEIKERLLVLENVVANFGNETVLDLPDVPPSDLGTPL